MDLLKPQPLVWSVIAHWSPPELIPWFHPDTLGELSVRLLPDLIFHLLNQSLLIHDYRPLIKVLYRLRLVSWSNLTSTETDTATQTAQRPSKLELSWSNFETYRHTNSNDIVDYSAVKPVLVSRLYHVSSRQQRVGQKYLGVWDEEAYTPSPSEWFLR